MLCEETHLASFTFLQSVAFCPRSLRSAFRDIGQPYSVRAAPIWLISIRSSTWKNISGQIETAVRYLNNTSSGRQWIANLYGNVFRAERALNLSGPQR